MRVLQLHNHHQSLGGAMEVLAHEAILLTGGGHEVREYTLAPTEELGLSGVRAGLKAVWNVEASRDVEDLIRTFRPDVVHVHTPFPLMSPAVYRAAHRLGVPAVGTLHSYRYSCIAAMCHRDGAICEDCIGKRIKLDGVRHRCYHDSLGASLALTTGLAVHRTLGTFHHAVTRFLALTDFARDLMIRDGFPADKVVVKHNSVPDPGVADGDRSGDGSVVFAGRLMDVKGVRTMLDAWRQAEHSDLQLRIAGDGPLRGVVEEAARADPSISYEGWVPEIEIFDLMGRARAVLVPSEWYEGGGPLVTLRSLAVGTPVVISDLENISQYVREDGTGVAFEPGNAQSLAGVLTQVAADPAGWRARRTLARRSYETRYSPEVDLPRLEAIYADAIASAADRS